MKNFLIIVILVVVGVLIYLTFFSGQNPFDINTKSSSVIKQMQSLNRFETASFTIEKIIDAGTNYGELKQLLFGDQLLLIAHGEVIAGFNLANLTEDSIVVEKDQVTLNLPAPEILITRLDNDRTRVYDRRQGLLTRSNKDLEAEARRQAEQSIKEAACEANILTKATDNGRLQLGALLRSLEFKTIIINIPKASC